MASLFGLSSLNLTVKGQRCLQLTQVRFRRIQSRNPSEPHFDRKAMIEVCKPIIPPKEYVCTGFTTTLQEIEPHPWNVIKAKKLRQEFEESRMILFLHANPISDEKNRLAQNKLFKKDIFVKQNISNEVIGLAIQDSFLANATPFTTSRNVIALSPHADIKTFLKLSKKMHHYVLLAGVIDRTFLSHDQLIWLATVPSIQSLQSVTVGLLAAHSQRLYANLNQHQQRLSSLLSEYSKESLQPKSSAESAAEPTADAAPKDD